tara:strand:- start:553 stop:822 length:270 start_codon:yes stop_codon:yes gene_type:complete
MGRSLPTILLKNEPNEDKPTIISNAHFLDIKHTSATGIPTDIRKNNIPSVGPFHTIKTVINDEMRKNRTTVYFFNRDMTYTSENIELVL